MDKNDVKKLENNNKDKKISKSVSPNSKNIKTEKISNRSITTKEQKIKIKNNKLNNKNKNKNKKDIEQNVSRNLISSLEISSKNTTLNKVNDTTNKEDKKTNFSEPKKNKKKKNENKIILNDIDSEILKHINNIPNYSNRSFDISTIRNLNTTSLNNSLNKSISKVIKTNTSIIEDQKYRNTLTDIYNKRKKRFSPKNNNKEKNDKNITYDRSINFIKRKQDKLKQLKTEYDNKEIENCTFKPIIIKNKYNNKLKNRNNNEFYQRNIEWKNVIKKNQNQLIDKSNEEMKECTFYPKTTKEVHEKVLNELKFETEPDFIFKKNKEWLDNVKQNRINNEKEIINQIKSEQNELKKNSKEMYEKIMGKKMEINKNNLNIINDNKKLKKEINFDEINNMIKEFKNIIENNKKFMKENQFNFKKYENDSIKKKNKFKIKNNIEGFSKYQNDINNKFYENLIKPKKWVFKKESEEEMAYKYNLLMEKYQKEKNN